MSSGSSNYLRSTSHPWACLLFIFPLLLAYEVGVIWLGGSDSEAHRTGADTWVRFAFQRVGLRDIFWPPLVIIAVFVIWTWLRSGDRPGDTFGVWLGMAVESVAFALILWGLWQVQSGFFEQHGIVLAQGTEPNRRIAAAISYFGAGIYEEFLFRLLLFTLLLRFMLYTEASHWAALLAAMALSAILFSAAHHMGPYGEEFHPSVFVFRALAGLYFAALFHFRGFGVTAGAHACYDVFVGVAMHG